MKCFYHKSDLDGHCSGAIVKYNFPQCEMIGVDYGDTLESLGVEFSPDEGVFVVDFCFNPADMDLLNYTCELHWIDHHKTSIDWANEKGFLAEIGGQRLEVGMAACELTWEYIFPAEDIPRGIHLLGRYDVWDHTDPQTLPFQWGMRINENTHPDNQIFWRQILGDYMVFVRETVTEGNTILKYQDQQNTMYAKGMSYEAEFAGYRAIVMNKAYANSKAFDAVYDPKKHDIMILFGVKPGECKYSLYSDKLEIDVSVIAKKYGGGGHAGAAGFYSDKLLL